MRNLLFSFLSLLIVQLCDAQSRLEILGADALQFSQRNGMKVTRLIGNVKLKQDETLMNCDSAYKFEDKNYVEAYGHVLINHEDSLFLYGDELEYDGNQRKAKLRGNARMTEKDFTLTTTDIDFDLNAGRADYDNGGRITGSSGVLTSSFGYYYTKSKEFFFKKNVVLEHPDYTINSDTLRYQTITGICYFYGPTHIISKQDKLYCEAGWYNNQKQTAFFSKNAVVKSEENTIYADTLFYDRKIKSGKAYSNVELVDTINKTIVYGNYAWLNGLNKQSYVTGQAIARQFADADTMNIIADTLYIFQKTPMQPQMIKAYYHTKVYKNDLQAVCDSMVYNTDDSVITLYNKPVLWSGLNQITADTILLFVRKQQLDSFYLNNNAFMVSRLAAKEFNQVKGKNMKGMFESNKMKYLRVYGNGQSIYYATEDSAALGVNVISCSEMEFSFKQNKIYRSNFITQPDAVFYPLNELKPEELRLKGFSWKQAQRPDKVAIKMRMAKKMLHLYKF